MKNEKKEKLQILYGYVVELNDDINKFRNESDSDIYNNLALTMEFECMAILSKINALSLVAPIVPKKRIMDIQSETRKLTCEFTQLKNEYVSWKGTGVISTVKKKIVNK